MLQSILSKENYRLWSSFDDLLETFLSGFPSEDKKTDVSLKPRADIHESEKEITLDVELPGLNKSDIKVDVKNDVLTISGERNHKEEVKEKNYSKVERQYGKFERSFCLPDTINSENIKAKYTDGLLTLTLPKIEKAIPKEIPISVN